MTPPPPSSSARVPPPTLTLSALLPPLLPVDPLSGPPARTSRTRPTTLSRSSRERPSTIPLSSPSPVALTLSPSPLLCLPPWPLPPRLHHLPATLPLPP